MKLSHLFFLGAFLGVHSLYGAAVASSEGSPVVYSASNDPGNVVLASVADPRSQAVASRTVKLRADFKNALAAVGPKLGIAASDLQNMLSNLDTMVPREGLLNPWKKSNSTLNKLGITDKDELPSMFEVAEGILIIQKAPRGENTSLTAFYSNDVTDPDAEQDSAKDSVDLAQNSKWAYRFIMRSRITAGFKGDIAAIKPIFILKYTNQIPAHLRINNDGMIYVMGDCVIKKLEVIARDTGTFGADNLRVEELLVDQRDQSYVELKGTAKSMDAVVDDDAELVAADLKADEINMNLSRESCKAVTVNPQKKLIVTGELETGVFNSINPSVQQEDGSVVWQNLKNMGSRLAKIPMVSAKAITFGAGYVSWKIVTIPFKFLGAIGKRLANAKVGVGGSVGVGPVRVGVGAMI